MEYQLDLEVNWFKRPGMPEWKLGRGEHSRHLMAEPSGKLIVLTWRDRFGLMNSRLIEIKLI